jgi:phosphoribosylformylglycinamidine synthase subunit PurL
VPVAATNCLNFGNPEKPEIMAQLSEAIDGIAEACTALGTPITGGNVSLYNETKGEGIYPTPVVGVVGILEDVSKGVPASFAHPGDVLLLIDAGAPLGLQEFGSTEYARVVLNATWGKPYACELRAEAELQRRLAALAKAGLIHAARGVSDGGLAATLAEGCFGHSTGVDVHLFGYPGVSSTARLFEEVPTRVIVTCAPEEESRIQQIFSGGNPASWRLGVVTDGSFRINMQTYKETEEAFRFNKAEIVTLIDTTTAELQDAWASALQSTLSIDVVTA